jgi:PPOX class F420-dependent enzyme/OxyR family protein
MVGPDGAPQNKPVGFACNAELGTIDIAGFSVELSARYRNVGVNPNIAFVVDDAVSEGAAGTRFAEIRGLTEPGRPRRRRPLGRRPRWPLARRCRRDTRRAGSGAARPSRTQQGHRGIP